MTPPPPSRFRDGGGSGELPLWKKIAAGSSAGVVGSAVANPTDVVKIRMQSCKPEVSHRGVVGYEAPHTSHTRTHVRTRD